MILPFIGKKYPPGNRRILIGSVDSFVNKVVNLMESNMKNHVPWDFQRFDMGFKIRKTLVQAYFSGKHFVRNNKMLYN